MKRIDLHIHTKVSADGTYDCSEIIEIAKKRKMEIIAICDHNSVRAVSEAEMLGKENGMVVIPGIEIDCVFENVNFHMTAYGIDVKDEGYVQLEEEVLKQSREITWSGTYRFLEEMGLELSDEVLQSISIHGIIVPEDLCDYLLTHEEYDHLTWLDPYRKGGHRSENPNVNFYWDYFSQGKIGYVKDEKKPVSQMIELVHRSKGVAVVAHPGANFKGKDELLGRLLDLVDGLEVYSTYHSLEEIQHYLQMADEHGCFVTCGSDFHGHHKPAIMIGEIPGQMDTEHQEVLLRNIMK